MRAHSSPRGGHHAGCVVSGVERATGARERDGGDSEQDEAGTAGGVPERSKGADCKSAGFGLRRFESFPHHWGARGRAGVAQLVEHQPSKLRVAGSSPVARSAAHSAVKARVAQSVERVLGKDEVTGSIPVASSHGAVSRQR